MGLWGYEISITVSAHLEQASGLHIDRRTKTTNQPPGARGLDENKGIVPYARTGARRRHGDPDRQERGVKKSAFICLICDFIGRA
jgi:hypothetical protein